MAQLLEPSAPLKREDIADEFAIVDMKACPITTAIRKGPAPNNMLFEYPLDKYAVPALGGRADGVDVAPADLFNGLENAAKVGCRAQWFHRAVGVGKIAGAVPDIAGVGKGKAFAYAIKKKLVELKRNIEYTLLSAQESAADNGTLGSLTRGIGKWIQVTVQSDQPVPVAYLPVAGQVITTATVGAFTEANLQSILEAMWGVTGSRDVITVPCRAAFQSVITNFLDSDVQSATSLPIRRFNMDGDSGTIKMVVNRYVGDFGECQFLPVPFLDDTNALKHMAYFLHLDRWHLRVQQNPAQEELPYGGGSRRAQLDAILGLACTNPLGEAKVTIL